MELQADANKSLDHPHKREDGERKRAPVYERRSALLREDRPERPGNRDTCGKVALGRGERVGGRGGLEEESAGNETCGRLR